MTWGGEDWGSPVADHRRGEMTKRAMDIEEEKGLLKVDQKGFIGTTASNITSSTEVKIKITKKQLEELLGKVDVKDMSVQQVLAQLISVSDRCQTTSLHRSWRPALQSIPEVN
ncbi:hypothetical protein PanWU01x14_215900 [Parasponia andersonii]|uniref:Uncharacterized protein n=1 Tax=Parasponia andersonii TaxID=3476 RepID=A0A2P5BRU0_PARAD|nr:hypothetical protein PanWU01x14_215900 [Parasponia andersonii]